MATLCVKPTSSGTGTGVDWTNALGGSFTPVRGNTYYFADGTYSGAKTWSTANSGTTTITFKKATVADHVTATGWDDTMGDGQADFTGGWSVQTDYWIFDGQSRSSATDWDGANTTYGFRVAHLRIDVGDSSGGCDNSTWKYCDIHGNGRDTGDGDDAIYTLYGCQNLTFQYCSIRDTDRTLFLMRDGPANWVVEYCFLGRNASSELVHGEMCSTTDGSNMVWRYNIVKDCEGTAAWAFINTGTASDWEIYGNMIFHSAQYATDGREGVSAVLYVANDGSQSNVLNNLKFYNNTVYNIKGLGSGCHIEAGTGNVVANCIWVNCVTTSHTGFTGSYNYYAGTSGSDGDTGTVSGQSANIFVSTASENFRLTGANAGTTLSSPYNVDMTGVTRGLDGTFDRGAYEYTAAGSATITATAVAFTNLTVG